MLLFHSNIHKPKAALEAQELGTAVPHCESGSWPHFEHHKIIFVAPQVTMKSCPAKHCIHIQVSTGRRARYAGKVEMEGSPKNSGQRPGTRKRQMQPDMDPSLRSAGFHCHKISRCRKPSAEPEMILSIFQRDSFFVTVRNLS